MMPHRQEPGEAPVQVPHRGGGRGHHPGRDKKGGVGDEGRVHQDDRGAGHRPVRAHGGEGENQQVGLSVLGVLYATSGVNWLEDNGNLKYYPFQAPPAGRAVAAVLLRIRAHRHHITPCE